METIEDGVAVETTRQERDRVFELEFSADVPTEIPQVGFTFEANFSPAERPTDTSAYTHKLNFELNTAVLIFNWLDEDDWLRDLVVEASLDYLASGLPRAGDVIGNERFLDDASPWSFSVAVILPLALLSL